MRIAWLGPPGWAPSGYGVQTRLFTRWLAERGHDVAVLAFAGCHKREVWEGVTYLPAGQRAYGNGLIAGLCQLWQADALVLMCDVWGVEPTQLGRLGIPVYAWCPLDAEPLGLRDKAWLDNATAAAAELRLVAMSKFGAGQLERAGYPVASTIPHAVRPEMQPALERSHRLQWSTDNGLGDDKFLFAKIGVNDHKEDRKAFTETLLAFAIHSHSHPDSWLYLHTEPQRHDGRNLAYMTMTLGLERRVRFPEEFRRTADLYDDAWMASMQRRADCYVGAARAEGFGVPIIESLACGTPVIATRSSAMTELVKPEYGRLVSGQREWSDLHHAWWITPSVRDLTAAMDSMYSQAAMMRPAAAKAAGRYQLELVAPLWEQLLTAERQAENGTDKAEPGQRAEPEISAMVDAG